MAEPVQTYLELLPGDVEDHVLDVVLRDGDEVEHVVPHEVHLPQLRRGLLQAAQRLQVNKDLHAGRSGWLFSGSSNLISFSFEIISLNQVSHRTHRES